MGDGRYLEEELQRRYRDAAPSTLTVLQQRCELVAAELAAAEQNLLNASDVPALRRAGARLCPTLNTLLVKMQYKSSCGSPYPCHEGSRTALFALATGCARRIDLTVCLSRSHAARVRHRASCAGAS